ncbi:MAG: regulatory iron-sulfur-containing complex subunit RicT [Muribaculaceae bacterium]
MNNNDKEQDKIKRCSGCPKQVPDCEGCEGCHQICGGGCHHVEVRSKLQSYNWLSDVPGSFNDYELVEVTFKNTRKGFYRNSTHLPLEIGDMVAVEANPGHDIGRVSMMGSLVKLQMKRANLRQDAEILRIFRKAKQSDLDRFEEAKAKETDTMIRSRKIAEDLHLNMKIGDVEYQGDGNKAIFYYIADERVDFRQLIKVLAEVFKIRIEMKQIGARQEAGRIGGIGPCGRPLCCSSWMTNFVSVATSAARYQDISLNPQKLAGQCAKLKCCINFEVDGYVEASKKLPPRDVRLETKDNTYFHFKTDIFKREITYSTDKQIAANLVTLSAERVFEVMALNKNGVRPEKLLPDDAQHEKEMSAYGDIIGQDSVSRFDKKKKKRGDRNRGERKNANAGKQPAEQQPEKQQQGGGNAAGNKDRRNNNRRGDNRVNAGNKPSDNANRQPDENRPVQQAGEQKSKNNHRRGDKRGNNGKNKDSQANGRRQENNKNENN